MRTMFVFLLFLCSVLLQGNVNHPFSKTTSSLLVSQTQTLKRAGTSNQPISIANYTNHSEKNEYIFSFETENEDEDISFSRKYTPLGLYFVTLFATTYLFNAGSFNFQRFCSQHSPYKLSYIYLLQRVLRI